MGRAQNFIELHAMPAVGLTETPHGNAPIDKKIGQKQLPNPDFDEENLPADIRKWGGVRVVGGRIVWTRDQSRLIEYIASYIMDSGSYRRFIDKGKHISQVHISTFYRFGKKLGISQREFRALRNFVAFWDAVNARKKEILGYERFHEVADAIYVAALQGDHQDRKLYLEVFCGHVPKKLVKKEVNTFERKLLEVSHTRTNHKPDREYDMEPQGNSFKIKRTKKEQTGEYV